MTKSLSREEFIDYVKGLEFQELEDAAAFVNEYFEYYQSLTTEAEEEKQLAWEKYIILCSKYGHWFMKFTLNIIEMRKEIQELTDYKVTVTE